MRKTTYVLIMLLGLVTITTHAQSKEEISNQDAAKEAELSEEDLAKKAQNPIANMISVPIQVNTSYGIGPDNRTSNVVNIQPVVPFGLGEKWNLITRTIIPIVTVPDYSDTGNSSTTGLGDINLSLFFAPKESKVIWGVGPIFAFPTATDPVLGAKEFAIGPSAVVVFMKGQWVFGATANHTWSVANSKVNSTLIQYFVNYNLPNSWYLSSAPIVTANWNATSGNEWNVPFGGVVGKIFKLGKLPINAQAGAFYNAVKPDGGADWSTRFQLQFLFPK
jgi:hypothetical protein